MSDTMSPSTSAPAQEYRPNLDTDHENTKEYFQGKLPMKAARKIRIIVVGAGASALSFAREVSEGRIQNVELVIYEKNSGIGGTWWENRYAGCACDIPSHIYQYSWAPNPNWSEFYSSASEIRRYMQDVAAKFDLEKYIKLGYQVTEAKWDESLAKWQLRIKNLETQQSITDVGDIFVNGGGIVNNWKWPSIQGLQSFNKELMHSAAWNENYDFRNKNVVIIGNGSSGVQITAALSKVVRSMTVVMRSPTWITPGFASVFGGPGGTNIKYTEEQKKEWRENPDTYRSYCRQIAAELTKRQNFFIKGSSAQRVAREFSDNEMKQNLAAKPDLAAKLIPSFDVGCRRPTPGTGYLEALTQSNTDVSWGTLQRVTGNSIILHDGSEVEPDAIVCATGFDLSYKPRFSIVGRDNIHLTDCWSPNARAYMSFGVPGFPNYLHYLGPATAASHGSLIQPIEHLTIYFVKIINKLQREGYQSFEPLQRCVDELDAHHQEYLKYTVWSSHCASTFKNGSVNGRINLLHGGDRFHYLEMLEQPRWEDFRWTVQPGGKLYDYFGNGKSRAGPEPESQARHQANLVLGLKL